MPTREPPEPTVKAARPKPAPRPKAADVVSITRAVGSAAAAAKAADAAPAAPVKKARVADPAMRQAKPAGLKPANAQPVAGQPAPEATPTAGPSAQKAPVAKSGSTLKLRDLTERVAAITGGKKKAVRQTVEAVLTVLGHALMAGDDLNLPPLGRARVSRQRDREDGEILMIRLKRHAEDPGKPAGAKARKAAKEALATKPQDS